MAKAEAGTSSELVANEKSAGRLSVPVLRRRWLNLACFLTARSLNGGKRRMSDPRSRPRRERRRCPTRTAAVSYIKRAPSPRPPFVCKDLTQSFAECFAQASRLDRALHSK